MRNELSGYLYGGNNTCQVYFLIFSKSRKGGDDVGNRRRSTDPSVKGASTSTGGEFSGQSAKKKVRLSPQNYPPDLSPPEGFKVTTP